MLPRSIGCLPTGFLRPIATCERTTLIRSPAWSSPALLPSRLQSQAISESHIPTSSTFSQIRLASSSSSTRWKARQTKDTYARDAKVAGLKSRAAFKLLEINEKHKLFRRGDTVVDLGYAPGSWSQVAVNRTKPGGRVVGIDVIPAQPPTGVSTLQGDFLSPEIREELRKFVREPVRARVREARGGEMEEGEGGLEEQGLAAESLGYVETERDTELLEEETTTETTERRRKSDSKTPSQKELDESEGRVVNVVLSDMCEPWPLTSSTWVKSVSNPYSRMMNTSGMAFRDHAGSIDLCLAALEFGYDTLVTGGNFLCKFYQGAEDHALELKLRKLFEKVHRIKPDSSRKESKEAYFVALRRKPRVAREAVFNDD